MNNQTDSRKKKLSALVLVYFEEGARSTNFYKHVSFEGYDSNEVRDMMRSLVTIDYLYRIDRKSTNGAGYAITGTGKGYLAQLRREGYIEAKFETA